MAKEIQFDATTGSTCYAMLRNTSGQIYNTAGAAFEAYNASNITDYDIAATEQGSGGLFTADMPSVAAGVYEVVAKIRAGGSPAESDLTVGTGQINWTGTAVSDTVANLGLKRAADSITTGTVGVGSTTTNIVLSSTSPTATVSNQFLGLILAFDKNTTTAALRGQKTDITANTTGALTVTALTTAPASGDSFCIE